MISLVGMPGSGKTTVGRQLARRLGFAFVDSDRLVEERIGGSIREFFAREGEEVFRTIEETTLNELTKSGGRTVVSTGGGAVVRPATRERLRQRGYVIYLQRTSTDDYATTLRGPCCKPPIPWSGCTACTPSATPSTAKQRISSLRPAVPPSPPW